MKCQFRLIRLLPFAFYIYSHVDAAVLENDVFVSVMFAKNSKVWFRVCNIISSGGEKAYKFFTKDKE